MMKKKTNGKVYHYYYQARPYICDICLEQLGKKCVVIDKNNCSNIEDKKMKGRRFRVGTNTLIDRWRVPEQNSRKDGILDYAKIVTPPCSGKTIDRKTVGK